MQSSFKQESESDSDLLLEKLCGVRLSDQNRMYCRRMLVAARQVVRELSQEEGPQEPPSPLGVRDGLL
jgi:hypothetical protein